MIYILMTLTAWQCSLYFDSIPVRVGRTDRRI